MLVLAEQAPEAVSHRETQRWQASRDRPMGILAMPSPRQENAMRTQAHEELEVHIEELKRRMAAAGSSLSADARLTGLAALVHSEALLIAADALHSASQSLVHDGLRPLMRRLPDR